MLKKERTKVMVFGTFDGIHKGHLNFFKQAKNLAKGSFLVVSVARDLNVMRVKNERPYRKERQRLALVKGTKMADKVILGGLKEHLPHIVKQNPDIIALGYDQKAYVKNLKKELKSQGLKVKIVRLKPHKEKIYKNHLLRENKV